MKIYRRKIIDNFHKIGSISKFKKRTLSSKCVQPFYVSGAPPAGTGASVRETAPPRMGGPRSA